MIKPILFYVCTIIFVLCVVFLVILSKVKSVNKSIKFWNKYTILGLGVGVLVGIIGVSDCWYETFFDIGDGGEGALGFLFIFGLPTTLLEFPLEIFGIVKGFIIGLISMSILFVVNWSIIGYLIGRLICFMLSKARSFT